MKRTFFCIFIPILLCIIIFLGAIYIGIDKKQETLQQEKINIVATIFPVYDFAKQIAGDKANIIMLLPPGTESHDYEPSPQDIIKIQQADLFIYTGKSMEIWAENIIESMPNKENVVDTSKNIKLEKIKEEHEEDKHEHESEYETHIWTNLDYASIMCDNILEKICQVDEENKEYYEENAKRYKEELDKLDTEFQEMVNSSKRKKIISASRFPFYYLTKKYGLEYEAAYNSCNSQTRSKCSKSSAVNRNYRKRKYTSYIL